MVRLDRNPTYNWGAASDGEVLAYLVVVRRQWTGLWARLERRFMTRDDRAHWPMRVNAQMAVLREIARAHPARAAQIGRLLDQLEAAKTLPPGRGYA